MSTHTSQPTYDVFLSYAHVDNDDDLITAYRDALEMAFLAYTGERLKIFLDTKEIDVASDWEMRIRPALRESKAMIAFLSPAYFTRPWCKLEWETFGQQEAARYVLGEGIRPLEIKETPALAGKEHDHSAAWIADVVKRQYLPISGIRQELLEALRPENIKTNAELLKLDLPPDEPGLRELHHAIRWVQQHLDRRRLAEKSPSFGLPAPNQHFVGRVRELQEMRRHFTDNRHVALAAEGIGGVGKSELAIMYAHAFAWEYPGGRYFIGAEGRTDLLPLLAAELAMGLGVELAPEYRSDPDGGFEVVRRHWEANGCPKILVVLDNVDVPNLSAGAEEPVMLRADVLHQLPPTGQLNLLATARGRLSGAEMLHTVHVGVMSEEEALLLIQEWRPLLSEEDRQLALELIRRVGRLTIAVEIVSVYLGLYRDVPIREYLDWLESDGLQALDESVTGEALVKSALSHPEKLISTLFFPTFNRLSPIAKTALSYASLMAPDFVVEPWLKELCEAEHPEVATTKSPRSPWKKVMDELRNHRILEDSGDAGIFRIHRLMAEVIGQLEDTSDRQERLEDLARRHEVTLRKSWVRHDCRWEIAPLAALANRWLMEGRVSGSEIASGAANRYRALGDLTEARRLLLKAIRIDEKAFKEDHPNLAVGYSNLAMVELDLDNPQQARSLLLKTLHIQEKAFQKDHPNLAVCYSNLAMAEQDLGNAQEARTLLLKVIQIKEEVFQQDHPTLAISYSNLAMVEKGLGNLQEARELLLRAIQIQENEYQEDHPILATRYSNLATVETALGNPQEARKLLLRTIQIQEKAFQKDHPNLAISYSNLAMVERRLGDVDGARNLIKKAIWVRSSRFGFDDRFVRAFQEFLNSLG